VTTEEPSNYWQQSRRPLTSLVFVLPLLIIYEGGVLALGPDAIHNGVEQWLRWLLSRIGFGQYLLLPVLTIALLLGWHHMTGEPWKVRARVVYGMLLESIVWAFVLVVLARIYLSLAASAGSVLAQVPVAEVSVTSTAAKIIGFCGAGLYEELLFRLMLLPAVMWMVLPLVKQRAWSALIAVVSTSIVFSAAHYVGPEAFRWSSFIYRTLAGGYFAVLFVTRGFGIAAGSHAIYDLFVGLQDS
jgi:membrane protease YdiL (CAAX protease family)